ncbi:MAG TPA: cell envelope integrity protein CreD [Fibrobacteria bacterium]|nr:cell envelope integrity protein CreD [Fibrobacteria bacterium]
MSDPAQGDPTTLPPSAPVSGPWAALAGVKSGAASMGKMAFIGLLMALLLIPVRMIQDLVREREGSRSSSEAEVTGKWGGTQRIAGPILTVPYRVVTRDDKGKRDTAIEYAHFLPERMDLQGRLEPEIRHRGIFDVALFKADLDLEGAFAQPDFSGWRIPAENILWGDAYVSLSVPDVRSLAEALPLEWNGTRLDFVPDHYAGSPVAGGLHVRAPMSAAPPAEGYRFKLHARLNGSGAMEFLPMGKETRVSVASPWTTPSFSGAFLPRDNRVDERGFQANWRTLHLSRSFPQSWRGSEIGHLDWEPFAFGVELKLPVDRYRKTMRCAKYAVLFILLTFLVFFLNETFDRRRIHPLQYALVGFALCLFYLLLLALTEHVPFNLAYAASAAGTIGLITAYGLAVLSAKKRALALGAMLAGLYGYLFTLLQMEDFALLMGALGLFLILGAVMFLTRRLNLNGPEGLPGAGGPGGMGGRAVPGKEARV